MQFHYVLSQDKEEIVKFVKAIEPCFGAINIEDIESPKVFGIMKRLREVVFNTGIFTISAWNSCNHIGKQQYKFFKNSR